MAVLLPELVRTAEVALHGLTRYKLAQLVESGDYERIAPGVFLRAGAVDDTKAAWMAIAAKKPQATLCLLSAAALHDLTDEIPASSHCAIPRGSHPVLVDHSPVEWHRFSPETFDVGRGWFQLPGGLEIGLYSAERTVIDLFRLQHRWGSDLSVAALKRWLNQPAASPSDLLVMARRFPEAKPLIANALEILL